MHRLLLFIAFLYLAGTTSAQTPFSKELWLNESNVSVKVNDLLYQPNGYIWLATDNGLYRFNGRKFRLIPDNIHKPVTALSLVKGTVYAGYKDGKIGYVLSDSIALFGIKNKRPISTITSLHSTGGFLWVTTEDEGVFMIMEGTGFQITTEDGLTDNFIYDATIASDEVMVATDRGIDHIRWDGKKLVVEVFTTEQGLPDNIVRVLRPIPNTRLCWVGTQEGGLALYDDKDETFHGFKMSEPWAWGQVNDILPITTNEAWVATDEGYLVSVKTHGDTLDAMPYSYDGHKLKKLVKDKAGNIWCATNKGLLMNTALYAASIKLPPFYQLRNITVLQCDKSNNVWFTQNKDLYKLALKPQSLPEYVLSAEAAITSICIDSRNNLWVGTFGKGVFYFDGKQQYAVRNIPELNEGHILSIAAVTNRLWISSLNGVEETIVDERLKGGLRWVRHHNKLSGTGSDYVYQLYPDRKGQIWMGTDGGGVCMFDGRKYHRWDSASGLTSKVVYNIAEDVYGNMWAGTLEKGLFVFRGTRWEQVKEAQGLQGQNISSIKGNASGQMVVVTDEGIDQWFPNSRHFRHYNRKLGMDIDSTSTILNCITNDMYGNVYVPFEHGLILFRNLEQKPDITPAIRINSINLFFNSLQSSRKEFKHDENHISFMYEGINFSNPEYLHYRYKLEGYDNNWIYTNDEIIPFALLPPGKYTFRVQASLSNYFDQASEARYSFTITKPFWQRVWFLLLITVLLFSAGYGYVKIRERGIRKMSTLQRERMVFEYEHLKSQVNPHFLFNSLNTLVNLIEEDKSAAVDYTVHLSDLYRNMLSYKDQDLIMLSEEYEIITNYMYIQKSRFGEAIRLHAEIPADILKRKKIVPLALQILVENAIKHNIVSLAQPLTISIVATEDEITVSNPIQRKHGKERGAGLGLMNIKKRYKLLSNRNVKFGIENHQYVVKLPLL
jgi:ligand-binding sensor domain-containing protein